MSIVKGNITSVNGIQVIAWEDAPSNLETSGLVPKAPFIKAEMLVLEDGTRIFGCRFDGCTYTNESAIAISGGHWKVHEPTAPRWWGGFSDWTLADIMEALRDSQTAYEKVSGELVRARQLLSDANKEVRRLIRFEYEFKAARDDIYRLEAKVAEYESSMSVLQGLRNFLNKD